MRYDFAVVGGDRRQLCLAEILKEKGNNIALIGLDAEAECVSLDELRYCRYALLPMPLESGAGMLSVPLSPTPIRIADIASASEKGQIFFCGKATESAVKTLESRGAEVVDYFLCEELTVKNAAITAEGAIYAAMRDKKRTLFGAKCVVTGYGRIGKMLSAKLSALGADVTVAARKASDRSLAEFSGCKAVDFGGLARAVSDADIIFNTVPEHVFGEEEIGALSDKCLFIELASAPYGADMERLRERVNAIKEASLPGRYAPESAAEAIFDIVYHIMGKRGWSV